VFLIFQAIFHFPSPEVATSYRKLAQTMANQFCWEMKSCITFIRSENQETRDIVTEEMVEVVKAFKEAQEAHTEKTWLEMEQLRLQLCSLKEQLQQRPEAPKVLNPRSPITTTGIA
jgi:cysteinyl-tRNA synthetase